MDATGLRDDRPATWAPCKLTAGCSTDALGLHVCNCGCHHCEGELRGDYGPCHCGGGCCGCWQSFYRRPGLHGRGRGKG